MDVGIQYVAPGGSDSALGRSWSAPVATLDEAVSRLPALIYVAPGHYPRDEPLVWPAGSNRPNIEAPAGPHRTRIIWNADGGTCFRMSDKGNEFVDGLGFRPGTGKPDVWADNSGDTAHDFGEYFRNCFFGDWNTATGEAAVKTGAVINCFFENCRWGGGRGPGILASATLGVLSVDRFTIDSQRADVGGFGGLIELDHQGGQKTIVRVSTGRVEQSSVDYAPPFGLVHVRGSGPGPAMVHVEDVDFDTGRPDNPHFVVAGTREGGRDFDGFVVLENVKALMGTVAPVVGFNPANVNLDIRQNDNILSYQLGGS